MRLAETAAGASSLAFAQFQAAAALSPRYYEAWLGMGRALLGAGAYAQAIPFYRHASGLFPPQQTGLCNDAANAVAACALVCGELDVAIELATLSIEHLRESVYDRELLAQGFRLRAEARLRAGQLEEARADLASQLGYWPNQASAHWLVGLYHCKRGEQAQALHAHALAVAEAARLAPYYDEADCLNFLYTQPVTVDWDGASMDAARP